MRGGGEQGGRRGKRAFDLLAAGVGLVLLAPLFLGVAFGIKLADGGPVFFRQVRVGRRGAPFRIWKFRTMVVDAERDPRPPLTVGRDPRITPLGGFLRQNKLDELPQLLNVLVGEMSLVGPRPEVPRYVALYTPAQRAVLELTPGITDPASLTYRDESELLAADPDPEKLYIERIMPAKIRLNLDYARSATLITDVRIVLRTVRSLA